LPSFTRQVWSVGDEAHRAAHRAGAEQRALRALENFDALQVVQLDVRLIVAAAIETQARDHSFVIVQTDSGLARGRNAADDDLIVAHTPVVDLNGRIQAREALQGERLALANRVAADRGDGSGRVLQVRLSLGRGDDDLLDDRLLCHDDSRRRGGRHQCNSSSYPA
jgi:hypothetical protein